jgi:hypothetical protein
LRNEDRRLPWPRNAPDLGRLFITSWKSAAILYIHRLKSTPCRPIHC